MNILGSKILLSVVGIVVAGLILSVLGVNSEKKIVQRDVRDLETKIRAVEKDNEYLNKFLTYFESPNFLQKEARLKLNYKSPGEEVVFVYRDLNKKASASVNEEALDNMPNYRRWIRYIMGH